MQFESVARSRTFELHAYGEFLAELLIRSATSMKRRHTFVAWYMMKGGELYDLAKILGHSNIKMTERCNDFLCRL